MNRFFADENCRRTRYGCVFVYLNANWMGTILMLHWIENSQNEFKANMHSDEVDLFKLDGCYGSRNIAIFSTSLFHSIRFFSAAIHLSLYVLFAPLFLFICCPSLPNRCSCYTLFVCFIDSTLLFPLKRWNQIHGYSTHKQSFRTIEFYPFAST